MIIWTFMQTASCFLLHSKFSLPFHSHAPTPLTFILIWLIYVLQYCAGWLPFAPLDGLSVYLSPGLVPGGSSAGCASMCLLTPCLLIGFGQWEAPSGDSEGGRKGKPEYLHPCLPPCQRARSFPGGSWWLHPHSSCEVTLSRWLSQRSWPLLSRTRLGPMAVPSSRAPHCHRMLFLTLPTPL